MPVPGCLRSGPDAADPCGLLDPQQNLTPDLVVVAGEVLLRAALLPCRPAAPLPPASGTRQQAASHILLFC